MSAIGTLQDGGPGCIGRANRAGNQGALPLSSSMAVAYAEHRRVRRTAGRLTQGVWNLPWANPDFLKTEQKTENG